MFAGLYAGVKLQVTGGRDYLTSRAAVWPHHAILGAFAYRKFIGRHLSRAIPASWKQRRTLRDHTTKCFCCNLITGQNYD
ncbi:hypothetical protein KCP74_04040 [Salmonella enterica subsp. enterica]|nr:hypothetical protein KCP74_04040 [Salmonella enterica subsp. enterica]